MPLYLIPTPIGNLGDITYRAVQTLQSCEYILCEDTRHSLGLLKHYEIKVPLKSYHKFNEMQRLEEVMEGLEAGKNIALISDAGTPGVCDPGAILVAECRKRNMPVYSLPGACAITVALSATGLEGLPFQFLGFVPKKDGERTTFFTSALKYSGVSIAYETAHRISACLEKIEQLDPQRQITVARELTKKFEELLFGTATQLIAHFQQKEPRGEIVLLIHPGKEIDPQIFATLSEKEHVEQLMREEHLSIADAIRQAAKLRGVSKRVVYNAYHQEPH